MLRSF
jgi:hypothetical protein